MTPPTDYSWIPLLSGLLQAIIPTVAVAIGSIIIATRVKDIKTEVNDVKTHTIEAKDQAVAANAQSVETAKAVNGRMGDLLTVTAEKSKAEGVLEEQIAESKRRSAATAGVPERRVGTDSRDSSDNEKLSIARAEAHRILDEAATVAKKLIEDARD